MKRISTASRNRAIVAATAFTIGALTVMLQDIIDLRDLPSMWENWSMKHTLAVLTILGVTLIAEEGWTAYKVGRPVVAAGIALVVAAGLILIVYNSVGRQVEATASTTLIAQDHNDKLAKAEKRLEDAKEDLKAANEKAVETSAKANCKTRCEAIISQRIENAEAEVKAARAALAEFGPPVAVAPTIEQWAEIMAIFGVDRDLTKKIAERFHYPLLTLLFEIGAMVSWCYVRREEETVAEQPSTTTERQPSPADTAQTSFPDPETDPPPPSNRRKRRRPSNDQKTGNRQQPSANVVTFPVVARPTATVSNRRKNEVSKIAARAWLLAHLQRHDCLDSQDVMADELGLNKGTVSKWVDEWETEGVIVREQEGRRKVVRLPETASIA